ncbi:MAG: mRNA interferase RelE/StbE [Pseudomonadota bacterium]|nr:mRNA interferase RelE/StbE [Pseudomonadota bacterium]
MNLGYKIIYDEVALRLLKKLDKQVSKRIINWLVERLNNCNNPRMWGSSLKGNLGEFWRYRVGDYRVLCKIQDKELIVLILEVSYRKDIYPD